MTWRTGNSHWGSWTAVRVIGAALLITTLTPSSVFAQNYNLTVLHSFTNDPDGANPTGNLVRDAAGNFYGTTDAGGPVGYGIVYEVNPSGHERVIHTFNDFPDGGEPVGGLIRDEAGNFYGMTNQGGPQTGNGIVFVLDKLGNETVLHNFLGGDDGQGPSGPLIRDEAGNLYGVTAFGGKIQCGSVFKLNPSGQVTTLHVFAGPPNDACVSLSGLARDTAGDLYGTTLGEGGGDFGAVYKIDAAGNESVLYRFSGGIDGSNPVGGVILDNAGNLFGTTSQGGSHGLGTVFKLEPSGVLTVLHSFIGSDGASPQSDLIRDAAGNLYGTARSGGIRGGICNSGCGVVFKLNRSGLTVLYRFTKGADGGYPSGRLIRDTAGNIYGTASFGGTVSGTCPNGCGVVFKLTPNSD